MPQTLNLMIDQGLVNAGFWNAFKKNTEYSTKWLSSELMGVLEQLASTQYILCMRTCCN